MFSFLMALFNLISSVEHEKNPCLVSDGLCMFLTILKIFVLLLFCIDLKQTFLFLFHTVRSADCNCNVSLLIKELLVQLYW